MPCTCSLCIYHFKLAGSPNTFPPRPLWAFINPKCIQQNGNILRDTQCFINICMSYRHWLIHLICAREHNPFRLCSKRFWRVVPWNLISKFTKHSAWYRMQWKSSLSPKCRFSVLAVLFAVCGSLGGVMKTLLDFLLIVSCNWICKLVQVLFLIRLFFGSNIPNHLTQLAVGPNKCKQIPCLFVLSWPVVIQVVNSYAFIQQAFWLDKRQQHCQLYSASQGSKHSFTPQSHHVQNQQGMPVWDGVGWT